MSDVLTGSKLSNETIAIESARLKFARIALVAIVKAIEIDT